MNQKRQNRRDLSDRRIRSLKNISDDKRRNLRREEDRKNIIMYYCTLYFSLCLVIALGIVAYIY